MNVNIGYFPQGSYRYVNSRVELRNELSVNTTSDYTELDKNLAAGTA